VEANKKNHNLKEYLILLLFHLFSCFSIELLIYSKLNNYLIDFSVQLIFLDPVKNQLDYLYFIFPLRYAILKTSSKHSLLFNFSSHERLLYLPINEFFQVNYFFYVIYAILNLNLTY
jgi:hypothetical protein